MLPFKTSSCPQQDIPEGDNLIPFVQWICHILVKLKLNYYCSNSLFSLIISIINFILALIKTLSLLNRPKPADRKTRHYS